MPGGSTSNLEQGIVTSTRMQAPNAASSLRWHQPELGLSMPFMHLDLTSR